ncbi:short-chain dehydrogenase [Neohortaea acidophila]|uniref:Short-chain dehydrogenase n=1 Tax=Neohortaea acidophila TaxID=245834 RepID=A0A6A6PI95_9PEZI|nr:short-chain dehydrogenase [Neohortaea acidophila]KAF2479441.1 short-chain dehydrogenase [Neohortaea acidophila]
MAFWRDVFHQCFFIPTPTLTEKNLPNQAGRVFIVTGGYAGVGKELCKILYGKNGTVYVAGRSQEKGDKALAEIKAAHPSSDGRVEFLKLDLSDLATIKPAVDEFTRREQRLDVLTNNAGVMQPAQGSKDSHGHELTIGTNCLGPYLLTQLLTPLLQKTAASNSPGSVRVTWAASLATSFCPTGGVAWDEQTGNPKLHGQSMTNYAQTKGANVLLAKGYVAQHSKDGIVSNAWNPGNLKSELQRGMKWFETFLIAPILFPTYFGAYTELFAGWSEEAGKVDTKAAYIGPWGRFVTLRKDVDETKEVERFIEWCEKETKAYR